MSTISVILENVYFPKEKKKTKIQIKTKKNIFYFGKGPDKV